MSTSLRRAERKAPAHNDTDYSRPVYKGELRTIWTTPIVSTGSRGEEAVGLPLFYATT